MAYTFNNFKNISGAAPVTTYPLTMACWVNISSTAASNIFVLHGTGSNINDSFIIFYDNSSGKIQGYVFQGGGPSFCSTTTNLSGNTWQHLCFVCTSATSRAIFLNGGGKGTDTNNYTPVSGNIATVRMGWLGAANSIQGSACEFAIWNEALSDAEVLALSKGFSAPYIKPEKLSFYAPLIRNINDYSGGITLTNNNGATVSDHPRIYGI